MARSRPSDLQETAEAYRLAAPALLALVLGLTVLLVVTLENWHDALTETIDLGAHHQPIPREDLVKVGVMVALLAAAAVAAVSLLARYRSTQMRLERFRGLNRAVIRNIPTGVLVLDADGRISLANPAAVRMLGLPEPETERNLELLRGRYPSLAEAIAPALEEGRHCRETDVQCRVTGRPIWLRVTTTDLGFPPRRGRGVVALLADVTRARAIEQRLRRLDRLAVTESLAAGVAHEVRNPLTAIELNLRLLRQEFRSPQPDRETVNECLDVLSEETERLNHITEEFLNFSRRQKVPHEAVSLAGVCAGVLQLVETEAMERGILVETAFDPGAPEVYGDPERLKQVLMNLVRNAIDAAPETGGRILVELASAELGGEPAAAVRVLDNGPGVDEEDLPRIFDPYFTTKPNGTGLGLAIAHRIVADHHGQITVENRCDGGLAVTVRLPAAAAGLQEAASDESRIAAG